MKLLKITDLDIRGKVVLIRDDLNVPIENGEIVSDARIKASIPTIKYALENNCAVIIISHLGRPVEGIFDDKLSLLPIAKRLSKLMNVEVDFVTDWINGVSIKPGNIVMCENVRFLIGEKNNDNHLAKKIASICDIYVNDAFAVSHRKEASIYGACLEAKVSCCGFLLEKEIYHIEKAIRGAKHPVVSIIGGSKISTKLLTIKSLVKISDYVLIGGGLANTFLAASNYSIGKSLCEVKLLADANDLIEQAKNNNKKLILPVDVVVCNLDNNIYRNACILDIKENEKIYDIGNETIKKFSNIISKAKTILWNGPLGVFEMQQFQNGTKEIALAITRSNAYSLIGGGDTIAALERFIKKEDISYISTGGGAFLEYLENKTLPGIDALKIS